jgi:short-subunit dehydrogenase
MTFSPRVIVITGASSGLGEALAKTYATRGAVLGLLGRDQQRLYALAQFCRARGTEVTTASIDVCDADAMQAWLEGFHAHHPIDLIIANAGISGGTAEGIESAQQTRRIMDVNVGGVMNTVLPVIPLMQIRKSGHIAIISSVAGLRGLPSAPAYSTSKAAVKAWGEGLRGELAPHGIGVSVVCPGFIRTPMTDVNPFPMPFMLEAEDAAARIHKGISRNKSRIMFPWQIAIPLLLLSYLPTIISDWIAARMPGKPPQDFKG